MILSFPNEHFQPVPFDPERHYWNTKTFCMRCGRVYAEIYYFNSSPLPQSNFTWDYIRGECPSCSPFGGFYLSPYIISRYELKYIPIGILTQQFEVTLNAIILYQSDPSRFISYHHAGA